MVCLSLLSNALQLHGETEGQVFLLIGPSDGNPDQCSQLKLGQIGTSSSETAPAEFQLCF